VAEPYLNKVPTGHQYCPHCRGFFGMWETPDAWIIVEHNDPQGNRCKGSLVRAERKYKPYVKAEGITK
jgi:hypothetical protein